MRFIVFNAAINYKFPFANLRDTINDGISPLQSIKIRKDFSYQFHIDDKTFEPLSNILILKYQGKCKT